MRHSESFVGFGVLGIMSIWLMAGQFVVVQRQRLNILDIASRFDAAADSAAARDAEILAQLQAIRAILDTQTQRRQASAWLERPVVEQLTGGR